MSGAFKAVVGGVSFLVGFESGRRYWLRNFTASDIKKYPLPFMLSLDYSRMLVANPRILSQCSEEETEKALLGLDAISHNSIIDFIFLTSESRELKSLSRQKRILTVTKINNENLSKKNRKLVDQLLTDIDGRIKDLVE